MITLTAKINILSGNNKGMSFDYSNLHGNNISCSLENVVGTKKSGKNPFIIGINKLGDGSTFSNGEDYFIGNEFSNDYGIFNNIYELSIYSEKPLTSITIDFDKINNRFPQKIKITTDKDTETIEEKGIKATGENGSEIDYQEVPFVPDDMPPDEEHLYSTEWYFNLGILTDKKTVEEISLGYKYEYGDNEQGSLSENIISDEGVNENGETILYVKVFGNIPEAELHLWLTVTYKITEKKEIIIGEYTDDDPIWTITELPNLEQLKIKISDWNTPNTPICIMGIYAEVSIEIDRRNLISISRSIFDRSDLKFPSFGIISNTGNIEFNDVNGEIRDYAEQLLLTSGLKCEILLNNTLVNGASQQIGLFETDQWSYDNDNRIVSVSIKDDLEEWQDINVGAINYDPRDIEKKPFSWLYGRLWAITNPNYPIQKLSDLDEKTYGVLTNTYIQYPLLESGSLWQQWTKLCQVCQLHIYKNNDGVIVCRYNGGN